MLYAIVVLLSEGLGVQAPRLMKMFDDGTALLRLRRGRHLSITKYFIIVVPDVLSRLRRPSDFRLDEVTVCLPVGLATQVNTPVLTPARPAWYSAYLPRRDGRLSWPRWLVTYRDGLPAHRRSPIQVLTQQCTAESGTCNLLITSLTPWLLRHLLVCIVVLIYSPDVNNVYGWRGEERDGIGSDRSVYRGLKIVKSCS